MGTLNISLSIIVYGSNLAERYKSIIRLLDCETKTNVRVSRGTSCGGNHHQLKEKQYEALGKYKKQKPYWWD